MSPNICSCLQNSLTVYLITAHLAPCLRPRFRAEMKCSGTASLLYYFVILPSFLHVMCVLYCFLPFSFACINHIYLPYLLITPHLFKMCSRRNKYLESEKDRLAKLKAFETDLEQRRARNRQQPLEMFMSNPPWLKNHNKSASGSSGAMPSAPSSAAGASA